MQRRGVEVDGHIALYEEVGRDAISVVRLGRALDAGGAARTVLVRQCHAHLAADARVLELEEEEARFAARLAHPRVVRTLEVARAGELVQIVKERVHGMTLDVLLERASSRGRGVPPDVAAAIVVGVAQGVSAVAKLRPETDDSPFRPLRTLSPDDVLVGADGVARLLHPAGLSAEAHPAAMLLEQLLALAPDGDVSDALERVVARATNPADPEPLTHVDDFAMTLASTGCAGRIALVKAWIESLARDDLAAMGARVRELESETRGSPSGSLLAQSGLGEEVMVPALFLARGAGIPSVAPTALDARASSRATARRPRAVRWRPVASALVASLALAALLAVPPWLAHRGERERHTAGPFTAARALAITGAALGGPRGREASPLEDEEPPAPPAATPRPTRALRAGPCAVPYAYEGGIKRYKVECL